MYMEISVNPSCRAFVQKSDEGCTTLGFDYLLRTLKAVVQRLGLDIDVQADEIGTLHQYHQYRSAVAEASRIGIKETWFSSDTPLAVQRILERYRRSGDTLRVFLGDTSTGHDWMEEFDTIGTVGRSNGVFKVPLLISADDNGGPELHGHCIVKMVDVATGKQLWVCKHYHIPELRIVEISPSTDSYSWAVEADGQTHARFSRYSKAARWLAFMSGEINTTDHQEVEA